MVETNKDPHNKPEAFDYLTPGEKNHLTKWIKDNLQPIKSFNNRHTSYGLKHRFENQGGFYIGNGAFKGAMLDCGFKVKGREELNWQFNISQKSKALQNKKYEN